MESLSRGFLICRLIHRSDLRLVTAVRSGPMLPPFPLKVWQFIHPSFSKSSAPFRAQPGRDEIARRKKMAANRLFNGLL